MAKKQGRKPIRRKPAKQIDTDLAELAEIIADHRLENNAKGWFELPWRDGRNAILLAHAEFTRIAIPRSTPNERQAACLVYTTVSSLTGMIDAYHSAQELLGLITRDSHAARVIRAALRCLQIYIARSDSGGHGYNHILRAVFEQATDDSSSLIETWRCLDAIRLDPTEPCISQYNERRRRAFLIAWRRGLYYAAYSISSIHTKGKP